MVIHDFTLFLRLRADGRSGFQRCRCLMPGFLSISYACHYHHGARLKPPRRGRL